MADFVNLPLPYAFDALEPYIDAETMELHWARHLGGYIDRLNAALAGFPALQSKTAAQLACLNARIPWRALLAINRNAGGVFNHRHYFLGMTPDPARKALCGALGTAILARWKTEEAFQLAFLETAEAVFGSGYAWLAADHRDRLWIVATVNQETPLQRGLRPLLCCDVWEHAYYLKHRNLRADYVRSWFCTLDWTRADGLFTGEIPYTV